MTEKKWSEYEKLVLSNLNRLDNRLTKLEDRSLAIEKCLSKLNMANRITLSAVLLLFTGLVTMAFKLFQ